MVKPKNSSPSTDSPEKRDPISDLPEGIAHIPLPLEMRKKVLEQKQHVTSKVSDLIRFIAFGLLAIYYTSLSADSNFAEKIRAEFVYPMHLMGLAGVVTILLDYLQFLCATISVNRAYKNKTGGYLYDKNSFSYRCREFCFRSKQATATFGVLSLFYIILGISNILYWF